MTHPTPRPKLTPPDLIGRHMVGTDWRNPGRRFLCPHHRHVLKKVRNETPVLFMTEEGLQDIQAAYWRCPTPSCGFTITRRLEQSRRGVWVPVKGYIEVEDPLTVRRFHNNEREKQGFMPVERSRGMCIWCEQDKFCYAYDNRSGEAGESGGEVMNLCDKCHSHRFPEIESSRAESGDGSNEKPPILRRDRNCGDTCGNCCGKSNSEQGYGEVTAWNAGSDKSCVKVYETGVMAGYLRALREIDPTGDHVDTCIFCHKSARKEAWDLEDKCPHCGAGEES